jgi:hypothetical protein
MGTLPSRDPARAAKHRDFINLYIFLQKVEFNGFGLNKESSDWHPSIKIKSSFKSQLKMLRIVSGSRQVANLVFKFFGLKQEK